jgi:acyl-CoA thioesterase FadM
LHQTIRQDTGEPVADADIIFVILDQATGNSVALNGEVRTRLEALAAALDGSE